MKNDSLVAFLILVIAASVSMTYWSLSPWESPLERSLLDVDEIPGDWKLDPGRSSNTTRFFYIGQLPDEIPAAVWLWLTQYDNSTAAHQEFVDETSGVTRGISQKPDLGDECLMTSTNSSSTHRDLRFIYCRVGDILINGQISFTQEYVLTDEWIFDLIQLQIDKIKFSMSIGIPLPIILQYNV